MADDAYEFELPHLPLSTPKERGFAIDRVLDAAVQDVARSRLNALGARMGLPQLDWRWDFNVAREVTITGRSVQPPASDRARLDALMWVEALGMTELSEPHDGVRWAYSQETYWEMRVEWVVDRDAWQFAVAARHEEDDRAEAQWAIAAGIEDQYFAAIIDLETAVRRRPGISTNALEELGVGGAWRKASHRTMHGMLEAIHRAARVQEGPVDTWWPITKGESGPPYRQPSEAPIVPTEADEQRAAFLQRDVDYRRLRRKITTLWDIDERLWKLVGGDDGGNRGVFIGSDPHTVLETRFRAPDDDTSARDPLGWSAYGRVGDDVVIRAAFPKARYSEDDVPARAALHALAMYYWRARTETHPRWRTLHGALRYLKPDLDHELAVRALDKDIQMLLEAWDLIAENPRGAIDPEEAHDMREIRGYYDQ